jgi:hypothetical protein
MGLLLSQFFFFFTINGVELKVLLLVGSHSHLIHTSSIVTNLCYI